MTNIWETRRKAREADDFYRRALETNAKGNNKGGGASHRSNRSPRVRKVG